MMLCNRHNAKLKDGLERREEPTTLVALRHSQSSVLFRGSRVCVCVCSVNAEPPFVLHLPANFPME